MAATDLRFVGDGELEVSEELGFMVIGVELGAPVGEQWPRVEIGACFCCKGNPAWCLEDHTSRGGSKVRYIGQGIHRM